MPALMKVNVDWDRSAGVRDARFFGYFLEHFHRQVYRGIFDPDSPLAGAHGFREDVLEAARRLRPAVLRWPGGCFASAYHWEQGVGASRVPSYDKAWRVEDPNTFGTDEFITLCRLIGAEPYLCTNAGTGTPEEMSNWLEYCNLPARTRWASMRAANGSPEPYGVQLWSIGNENYGFWEVGAREAAGWGQYVREAARLMRRVDDRVILAAPAVVDFEWDQDLMVDWNLGLLRAAAEQIDLLAIHGYAVLADGAGYLESVAQFGFAESRICRAEDALRLLGLQDKIRIAFDEWNPRAWNFPGFDDRTRPDLSQWDRNDDNSAYTMADALLHAGFLNASLRHCRSVTLTNMSPLVNARGPIFTHERGVVLRPTYHVCELYTSLLAAEVLDSYARVPTFVADVPGRGPTELSRGDMLVTVDRASGTLAASVLNMHPAEGLDCELWVPGRAFGQTARVWTLTGESPDSFNDIGHPEDVTTSTTTVTPHGDTCRLTVPPHAVCIVRAETTSPAVEAGGRAGRT
jgi:alpha-N-arabinofuranosidase